MYETLQEFKTLGGFFVSKIIKFSTYLFELGQNWHIENCLIAILIMPNNRITEQTVF